MKTITYLLATFAFIYFTGCKKSGTSPSKQNGGTTATAMYPATSSLSNNGQAAQNYTYTYDSNNNLIKYGTDGLYEVAVDAHNVSTTAFVYNITGNNVKTLTGQVIYNYAYSGPSNTPVDIYTNTPAQVTINVVNKNITDGTSQGYPGGLWAYEGSKNQITKMATSDNGGQNINYTYDTNGNLKTVSFINLSGGPQAGKVVSLITVTALDNKPSPFSAVGGYNVISYPQNYLPEYALAFCKNNPTQITYQQYDYDTDKLQPNEQDDFTYIYNAQGYPTDVSVQITYFGINGNIHGTRHYTYTYK